MISLLLTLLFACGDKETEDTAAPAEEVQEEVEAEDTATEPEDSGEEESSEEEESTEEE